MREVQFKTKPEVIKGLNEVRNYLIGCCDRGELSSAEYNELQAYIQDAIRRLE